MKSRTARQVFEDSKLRVVEIAAKLGLSRDAVYKYKAGFGVSDEAAKRIAREFRVTPVYVMGKGWRFE